MYKKTSLFIFTVLTVLSYFVWEKPNCSHVFNVFLITLQKVDGNGIKKQKTKLNFVKKCLTLLEVVFAFIEKVNI